MGAGAASKTIWYSVCHLKFNNLCNYLQGRKILPTQSIEGVSATVTNDKAVGNSPSAGIYVGKCTFHYELYNPTNYLMTVYIYDLICKCDTPHQIAYSDANNDGNSAPEACMQKGSKSMTDGGSAPTWQVADPTLEMGTYWNTVGMKPTDYHLFNTIWKVKGMKKIILPPGSSHHHVVIYNPKKKITNASLLYPRETRHTNNKMGIGGITQATLFGFEGQVATEDNQRSDGTIVGTLPGKLLVKCIKKVNIWDLPCNYQSVTSEDDLVATWTKPTIFSDLVEVNASST
ncbi:hypothetical protein BCR36DRAFT_369444 [Piromyces finnis]|uniref:Uncharacterized protein n=1 Tax=Piromyces finnis TaxID=1754191 RepID=A0A1Y1VCF1_9FUNG|nr:hypothetical protein BCR36DRAFT_444920 [Piromyces finnis]ORX52654.1 hypothetical protein BCR36DRAFT_369444 [Piromyces finnis]|eukprot:ORX36560.1 hypothetical protein BCR36DRAFT_444920 [Piromyces finnis]